MKIIELNMIGSDPEFFIQNEAEILVPSFNIINGTKERPESFDEGYAILKDNALIEGNIPPAKTKQEFVNNMTMLKELMEMVLSPKGLSLKSDDIGYFTDIDLDHVEAGVFGCSNY